MPFKCLCTLEDLPSEGYNPAAARRLAGGQRRFPHRFDFNRSDVLEYRQSTAERMSISGMQDKISLILRKGVLVPAAEGGEYILKPIPSGTIPKFKDDVPANEQLTMLIANTVYGISTAVCALILFKNGEPAYITKRFDRMPNGAKVAQEDFCQLLGFTDEIHGKSYKYEGSYEETGEAVSANCSARAVELDKLFTRILFNYVFSNGDAHLKNFSIIQKKQGDYILSPAYDLICTSVHFPDESRCALELFKDGYETESFKLNAFHKRPDFIRLASLFGIKERRAIETIESFPAGKEDVLRLVKGSFLSKEAKKDYAWRFEDRLKAIHD